MRAFRKTHKEYRISNVRRLARVGADARNNINDYERELVRLLEYDKTGVYWHIKQATYSRYIADFYVRHIKLAVFLNTCSQEQMKCLQHYGFHVLTIDPLTVTPVEAAALMGKRVKTLKAMHDRRVIR